MKRFFCLLALLYAFTGVSLQAQGPSSKITVTYASGAPTAPMTGLKGLTAGRANECQTTEVPLNGIISEVLVSEDDEVAENGAPHITAVTIAVDGIADLALGYSIPKTYILGDNFYEDETIAPGTYQRLLTLLNKGQRVTFLPAKCGTPPVLTLENIAQGRPPSSQDGGFSSIFKEGLNKSEVSVVNGTNRPLTIVLGQQSYRVGAQKTQLITLEPGNYNYRASAPGFSAITGQRDFARGYSYTWQFRIVTQRVRVPARRR